MSSRSVSIQLRISSTPIEVYTVKRRRVHVKRDDLCSRPPAPPLGKLRGLRVLVSRLVAEGVRTIGCWDTRVSKLGIGLAAAVRRLPGVKAVVCYPQLKNRPVPEPIRQAESLGAEIFPMRGNHVAICFAQATKTIAERGGAMLPFGMDCPEAVDAIATEARTVPADILKSGTVVLSCGSGVTVSGLLRGFEPMPAQIIGVSAGRSLRKLKQCIMKHVGFLPSSLTLVPAAIPYDVAPLQECPFPAHPHYDLKAWRYLSNKIAQFPSPLLFWNIGA